MREALEGEGETKSEEDLKTMKRLRLEQDYVAGSNYVRHHHNYTIDVSFTNPACVSNLRKGA